MLAVHFSAGVICYYLSITKEDIYKGLFITHDTFAIVTKYTLLEIILNVVNLILTILRG